MWNLWKRLSPHGQQPAAVDVTSEMRQFTLEIRELRHLFELQVARQASEVTPRDPAQSLHSTA